MLGWMFRPRPYPQFVLIAIVLAIFGFNLLRRTAPLPTFGWILLAMAAVLVISFVRGVLADLELQRSGLHANARVTKIENVKRRSGRRMTDVWLVHYTFVDQSGGERSHHAEIATEREASQWSAGDVATIRYHPAHPHLIRWPEKRA